MWKGQLKKYWESVDRQIPKAQLQEKHLANLVALPTRQQLLERMPKHAVVAELGVDQGDFSQKILTVCQPSHFHLVDFWGSERYNQAKRESVERKFQNEIDAGRMEINLGLSTSVVSQYPDRYFDWIYIDTDHSYKTTRDELEAYRLKMKPGGIIAGHDYIIGNWNGSVRYGVVEAVAEFCVQYEWELLYITMEAGDYPSFAIRKCASDTGN